MESSECTCSFWSTILLPCRHIISARLHKGLPLVELTTIHQQWLKSYQIDFVSQDIEESFHNENSGNNAVYDVLQEPPVQGTLNQVPSTRRC